MNEASAIERSLSPQVRSWRVTTATRVFVVALAAGQVLSAGVMDSVGVLLVALVVLATIASAVELETPAHVARWIPAAEGMLAATLLGSTDAPVSSLLGYLALPPVVSGIRHGWVSSMNTALATGLALAFGYRALESLGSGAPQLQVSLPWVMAGLGTGLLAAWLTRSVRALEEAQAPLTAAHRLLTQLRDLSLRLPVELDSETVARRMVEDLVRSGARHRAAVYASSGRPDLHLLADAGLPPTDGGQEHQLAMQCARGQAVVAEAALVACPLRVGNQVIGAVVLTSRHGESPGAAVIEHIDEQALRLDAAFVFEEVRALATSEERNRLAREIHDGVAQEVASLGYLLDELAAGSRDPATLEVTAQLRGEVTRIVNELRLSIFDLRHGLGEAGSLAGALSDYAQQLSRGHGLRVHLMLDDQRTWLPPKASAELLRIGQEAISNVRRHAGAANLWVLLASDGQTVRLQIADDGHGAAQPRSGHYGMHTMRERAAIIHARLHVGPRDGGGTVVTVELSPLETPDQEGALHGEQRAASR